MVSRRKPRCVNSQMETILSPIIITIIIIIIVIIVIIDIIIIIVMVVTITGSFGLWSPEGSSGV